MEQLLLYTTTGCHLCEIALQLILSSQKTTEFQVELVEISDSESLVDQYGIRIPVVADKKGGAELGWPFDYEQFQQFVDGLSRC
ncbi:glutaredoxin family protein [Motiliproteus sp. MSK22-1]|uniref:glutaredoxin family protein n=1 Tax=Motiliproteus sp. MSK22-1 TaxID=1897630 RepID=UPI000977DDC8|nr:glutaredoxin family protein [Motiliproteus sp. MSK22-1]OMH38735.1 hypothetical protein BGP75_05975 [Motiliproteus sp. MSK22-1]